MAQPKVTEADLDEAKRAADELANSGKERDDMLAEINLLRSVIVESFGPDGSFTGTTRQLRGIIAAIVSELESKSDALRQV
jgi:hypothetical protein